MVKKILGLIVCGAVGASVWVLLHLSTQPLWYLALPIFVAVLLGVRTSMSPSSPEEKNSLLSKLGIALAIALTLGYRFSYLETVPSGIDSAETPLYTEMAAQFLLKGFWYTPYIGYLHTLYGYICAVGMAFVSDWEWGFRFATAFCSALTVLTSFFAIRALSPDCPRAAWIGAGLMAASPWHIWISRFLMQKYLLTLCESITLLGLTLTVTAIKGSGRYWGAALAAFGFVLGLHAYWGCYVLAPVWATFLLYLLVFHTSRVRQCWGPTLVACVLAAGLSVPLILELLPQLSNSGYVKSKIDYGDTVFLSKFIRNLDFLFWALSSAHSKHGSAFIPAPITFLFLVGLARAIRRFRSSITSALIVINFCWFFAGIALTWAHDMYMTGLIFSVYCLAGQGLAWIGQSLVNSFGVGRAVFLGILPIAFVCHQAFTNYTEAFMLPRHTAFGPYVNPATHLRKEIQASTETHSVWLPKIEFGERLRLMHDQGFPDYAFVRKLNTFKEDMPWFDLQKVRGTAGVEMFFRPMDSTTKIIDGTLKQLYPHVIVTALPVPPPYDQAPEFKDPRAIRVTIPLSDIMQLKEASSTQVGDTVETRGYLTISDEGIYSFCYQDGSKPQLTINDQALEVTPCADGSAQRTMVFLGIGLHPVVIRGERRASELTLVANPQGGTDIPFTELVWGFASPTAQEWARVHRGDSGKPATFGYEAAESYPITPPSGFRQISGFSALDPVLLFMDGVYGFDRQARSLTREVAFAERPTLLGRPGSPLIIQHQATKLFAVTGSEIKLLVDTTGKPIIDFDHEGELLATLHPDGTVSITRNGAIETTVPVVKDEQATSVAFSRNSLFVATQKGIYFKNLTTGAAGKVVAELSVVTGLSSDAEGNIYAWTPHSDTPTKVFNNGGERLFNASAGTTNLFVDKEGKPVNRIILPKFLSDTTISFQGDTLQVFQRRGIP
jgi:hypothetical protein